MASTMTITRYQLYITIVSLVFHNKAVDLHLFSIYGDIKGVIQSLKFLQLHQIGLFLWAHVAHWSRLTAETQPACEQQSSGTH